MPVSVFNDILIDIEDKIFLSENRGEHIYHFAFIISAPEKVVSVTQRIDYGLLAGRKIYIAKFFYLLSGLFPKTVYKVPRNKKSVNFPAVFAGCFGYHLYRRGKFLCRIVIFSRQMNVRNSGKRKHYVFIVKKHFIHQLSE